VDAGFAAFAPIPRAMIGAINSAVWGLNDAGRRFDAAAENVAAGTGDLASELVEGTIVAPAAYTANAAMFRAADETRGYLLDVIAR
jgi:hypothetical protein